MHFTILIFGGVLVCLICFDFELLVSCVCIFFGLLSMCVKQHVLELSKKPVAADGVLSGRQDRLHCF